MPHADESMDARGAFRTLGIIHLAFCASVLIYGLIAY